MGKIKFLAEKFKLDRDLKKGKYNQEEYQKHLNYLKHVYVEDKKNGTGMYGPLRCTSSLTKEQEEYLVEQFKNEGYSSLGQAKTKKTANEIIQLVAPYFGRAALQAFSPEENGNVFDDKNICSIPTGEIGKYGDLEVSELPTIHVMDDPEYAHDVQQRLNGMKAIFDGVPKVG